MNLPTQFVEQTRAILGNSAQDFLDALVHTESPVSIRVNKGKTLSNQLPYAKVPWCDEAYYLEQRPQFTFDPLFHMGHYYVQEASSMFVSQALKQYAKQDMCVLDLCAAPGGKSTLIADFLGENGLLLSNEVIYSRANILSENITKWGKSNTVVTNNDPSDIGKLSNLFDLILVDAPCSGEGMFRKDEGAVAEWSLNNVKLCKERQQRILADVWAALKPGGFLFYSTCTYNTEENEQNVAWVRDELGAEVMPLEIDESWGISGAVGGETLPVYRFFPHKTKGEGFFFTVLRKNGESDATVSLVRKKKEKDRKPKEQLLKSYCDYLIDSDTFSFFQLKDNWHAFPKHLFDIYQLIASKLKIISCGVCLGELKGKSFIPNQSLAMSNDLSLEAFPCHEVDWKTAINYLRKEAIVLDTAEIGYVLLTYKGSPLGFVKNLGNRANNLYPQEWRIRSSNLPPNSVKVL